MRLDAIVLVVCAALAVGILSGCETSLQFRAPDGARISHVEAQGVALAASTHSFNGNQTFLGAISNATTSTMVLEEAQMDTIGPRFVERDDPRYAYPDPRWNRNPVPRAGA